MKKKLILVIFFLLAVSGFFLYFFINKKESSSDKKIKANNPEVEKLVNISQSEMSSFIFVTQQSQENHILNINLTPFLSFNIPQKEISSFRISNFKGTNSESEVILVSPTDLSIDTPSRTFLFTVQDSITQEDIKPSVGTIDYIVSQKVSKFNEVKNIGVITPNFGIVIKDIGSVNYKEVLERDGSFDGSKYLEYSKTPSDALDTEIQFDVNIKFVDGKKYNKRFKALLKGEAFTTETSPLITLEVVK